MTVLRTLVVTAVLAVTTALAPTATAVAEDCSDGVVVVIDASAIGGGITTTCVQGAPGTGLDALAAAGHQVGFVPGQFGFICTIDKRPDPCNRAPSHAYWSYWIADQGGSWSYSNAGAAARSPAPGTVDGWRFGDGSRAPGISPPGGQPVADPEPPSDPEQPPSNGTPPGGSSGGAGSGGSGSGGSGSGSSGSGSSGSGSSGSSGSGSSGSSGSGPSGSGGSGSGEGSTDDRQGSGSGGNAGTGNSDQGDTGPSASDEPTTPSDDTTPDAVEGSEEPDVEPDVPDRSIEPAELPEEPLSLERRGEPVAEAEEDGRDDVTPAPRDSDDDLALTEGDSDGVPTELVAGGGLLAGLAGLTAFQVRRRRLEA